MTSQHKTIFQKSAREMEHHKMTLSHKTHFQKPARGKGTNDDKTHFQKL